MTSCTLSFLEKTILSLLKMTFKLLFLKYTFWNTFYELLFLKLKNCILERIFQNNFFPSRILYSENTFCFQNPYSENTFFLQNSYSRIIYYIECRGTEEKCRAQEDPCLIGDRPFWKVSFLPHKPPLPFPSFFSSVT